MDISGGVDSAADLVDQGLTSTPVRSSFKFFPRAHFLNCRNMPPPPLPTSRPISAALLENPLGRALARAGSDGKRASKR